MSFASAFPRCRSRGITAALAWIVLATALAISAVPAVAVPDETFSDDFSPAGFNGSDGSLPWATDWIESGETDGFAAGTIQVRDEPNCETDPCLNLGRTAGPDATVEREADLSRYAEATLTFDYKVHAHLPGAGVAALKVSDDGGDSWTTLDTWSLDESTGNQVASYDISEFIAPDTRILFAVTDSTDDSHMNVDDLEIAVTGAVCYLVGDNGGTHQLTSLNLADADPLVDEVTIGDTGTDLRAIALHPVTGELYAATADELHIVDTATGAVTPIGPFGSSGAAVFDRIEALAFDPTTGILYASQYRPGDLDLIIQVDPATGSLVAGAFGIGVDYVEFISDRAAQVSILGLAVDATGQMWGMGWDDNSQEKLHYIDKATGSANADFNSRQVAGLSYDAAGTMWGLDPTGEVFEMRLSINSRDIDNLTTYTGIACATTVEDEPDPNQPPVFDQDHGDRADAEGALITLPAPATDPDDDDTLTYAAIGLPEGLSIDEDTGTITGALGPNSSGTHSVTITVTDDGTPNLGDTDIFTWSVVPGEITYLIAGSETGFDWKDLLTVADRNDPDPVTNEVTIGSTGTIQIRAAALQPGSNVLYAVDGDQLGIVDVTTGEFTPLPSSAGAGGGAAGLVAFDAIDGLSFNPFSGELYATHRRSVWEEDLLLRLDPITGAHIPGAFDGDDYVVIEQQGSYWHSADIAFDPTSGRLYMLHWTYDRLWSLAEVDPASGATVTIGATPDDIASLAFDESGRLFTSTNTGGIERIYELSKIDASVLGNISIDNGSRYEAMAIAFPVDPNQAPVFEQNLLDRTDPEGSIVSLPAAAIDPDGDNVGYAATGLPPGLTIDPISALISGTIDYTAAGTYGVEITVTDDGIPNLEAVDTFTWTVVNINRPPVFDQDLLDRTDAEGTAISLSGTATDSDDGDTVTYAATGLPPGLLIDPSSGLISGTIDYTAAAGSPYAVSINAGDDQLPPGNATPDTFTWTITNTNQAPVIVNPGPQTTPELAPISLIVTASDPDATIPSLTDSGTLPAWAVLTDNLDGTATISGTPGIGDSGTTTVTVTASDGALTDDADFDITVTNTNVAPTIDNPGNQTGNEGSPFSVVLTASDPDGTTVSFTDSGIIPGWATLVDNGDNTATISGTPGYDDAGTTTVTITASDGSLTDDAVFSISIANTNRAPVVAPITDRVVVEGDALVPVVAIAADPDGTIPSLVATGLPGWASFVDNGDGTGTITGTPGYEDATTTTVTIQAFDGSLTGTTSFDLIVTNTNRAPILSPVADQSVAEGDPLPPVTITAIDPDGTVVALAASGLPGWASFVDNGDGTGTITGTPGYDDAGETTVTVYGEDGGTPNLSDMVSFAIMVTNTNRAPALAPITNRVVAETAPLTPVTASASDPDGTIPSLVAAGLPGWASFADNGDGTGTITGTPGAADAGTSIVTITASDGDLIDTTTFALTVTEGNLPPLFDAPLPDRTDAEGDAVTIDASAGDPNGDNLSYSAVGLPPGVAIDPATGQIAGTLPYNAAGTYAVQLSAEDDGTPALSTVASFVWTVTDINRAPVLAPIAPVVGPEGTQLTFTATAFDPDGHSVAYSIAGAPAGAAIDPDTGVFTWTPGEVHGQGSYAVTVVAGDSGTPVRTDTKTVIITVAEVNLVPDIEGISDQHDKEGDSVNLQIVAFDPDIPLNTLSYAAAGLPAGLAVNSATGSINGTVAAGTAGTYDVTVTVTDDGDPVLSATASFVWQIGEDVNRPPVMEPLADRTVAEHSSVTVRPVATDPDGDPLWYEIAGAPPGSSFDPATGTLRWTPAEDQGPGVYRLSIIAVDSGTPELVSIEVIAITVTEVNEAPTIETLLDRVDDAGEAISMPIIATDGDEPANALRFAATDLPPGLAIDPTTGVIGGQIDITTDEVTYYNVTVRVVDDGEPSLEAATTFTWTVIGVDVLPENLPPSVDPIGARFSDAGTVVAMQVRASDTDPLTFFAEGLPGGLTIDPVTGLIGGTVAPTAVGSHAVVVTVADNAEPPLRTAVSFTWTVTDRDAADQKDDVVVAIVEIEHDPAEPTADTADAPSRPLRRGLVVMSTAAAATTESLRLPFVLLLAMMVGFATLGRIGLYPLLWRGERHTGTISFFDDELSFGLIHPDEGGEDVFVHAHAFPRRQRGLLKSGLRLRYRVLTGDNRSSAWGATLEGVGDE